jgi:formylmethanofuran dehydrogenase subunit C
MTDLTLTMKYRPNQRVDMSPITCDKLAGLELAEIAAIELQNGKRKLRVDELFSISGSDVEKIHINNSFSKLDYIGHGLDGGSIRVTGDVGAYLAMNMRAGEITVSGNVGIYAACQMKNGFLQIMGDVGDFLGGALPGNKKGIQGGTVLIKGSAGDRVGDHMRRGMILIEGGTGDYCGARMTAGTIAVMGETGRNIGYGMRRGTLLLWQQPKVPVTFGDCGTHTFSFLPMLFKAMAQFDSKFSDSSQHFNRVHRYGGDIAGIGRGEILVRVGNA